MQNGINRQKSLKEKLKSSLCCFSGTVHSDPLERGEGGFFYDKLRIPKTPISPQGSTSSTWFKIMSPTSTNFGDPHPRVRGRSLKSRMGRKLLHHRQSQSADFSYDPSSYALNFEDDSPQEFPFRNFSSRLPSSPSPVDYSTGGKEIVGYVLQIKTLNSSPLSLFVPFLPILPRPAPFLCSPNSNNGTTSLTPTTSPPHVPLPDSGDQIPTTSALTFASTSWSDSSNGTAHRSDEVDASYAAKKKSKRKRKTPKEDDGELPADSPGSGIQKHYSLRAPKVNTEALMLNISKKDPKDLAIGAHNYEGMGWFIDEVTNLFSGDCCYATPFHYASCLDFLFA
ncbi:hypothetical protein HKD37_17G048744 [Glycine soja]